MALTVPAPPRFVGDDIKDKAAILRWMTDLYSSTLSGTIGVPRHAVASLPTGDRQGEIAYATDGRKNGETAGNGTGVLVFHDGVAWRASDTGATVSA